MRARPWAGRALGLLAPAALALSLRVLVPWRTGANFHPPRIWLGETALSSFLLLALAFVFYTQPGEAPATPPNAGSW